MIQPRVSLPTEPADTASSGVGTEGPCAVDRIPITPRPFQTEPRGGESVIDVALCWILSVAIVSLLPLALL